jgi:rhamnose transport system ATP-binding protein
MRSPLEARSPPPLAFQGISKSFGAVHALRGVTFSVAEGEAHALVGENGAGKSTLMRVLAGIVRPDAGTLTWNGRLLDLHSPRAALDQGIGMVYQEMLLFPNLSAAENIFAGREVTGSLGRLRKGEMRRRTAALLQDLHVPVRPDDEVAFLSAAQQQLLQIARALAFDCRILILDEPTTSLTGGETTHLFATLDRLRARGVTLLYVSHKLEEVFRLCDRITVLRDGQHVGTFEKSATSPPEIVRAMVGRDLEAAPPAPASAGGQAPLLEVTGLTRRPCFEDVSLSVRAGEIVGVFGLVGSGRSEFLETLFGLYRADRGTVRLQGRAVHFGSPVEAVRAGLALVPEERHRQGLFFNLCVRDNLLLPSENAAGRWRRDGRREAGLSRQIVERWRIKTAGTEVAPDSLSGGNQQKVVMAKWLHVAPRLLLLDEPTKGVDIGAKWEIHDIVRRQAEAGMGCLVVSSDLPEVLALAHRIVVLRQGRVQGELSGRDATEESVMRLATAVGAGAA